MKSLLKIIIAIAIFLLGFPSPSNASTQTGHRSGISTPDNEGSLLNLSGEMQTSANMGSASENILLELPEWRGLLDDLTLNYSSQTGHSTLGYGWDIFLPSIRRSEAQGVPSSDSDFMGPEGLLVEIEAPQYAPQGHRYFRSRIDKNQNLYVLIKANDGFFFEIHDGAGQREIYGQTFESREGHNGLIVQWNLNAIVDAYGNAAVFTYTNRNNVSYVQSIEMVNGWQSATESLSYSIQFAYEDRPDTWRYFGSGIPQVYDLRLRSIKTFWVPGSMSLRQFQSSLDASEKQSIRSYSFQYDQKGPSKRSLLSRLDMTGAYGKDSVPGYSFTYAEDRFSSSDLHRSSQDIAKLPNPNLLFWNDFNRDGLSDTFSFSREAGWQIWFNLGDNKGFSEPKAFPIDNLSIQNKIDTFVDLNLDFIPDILRWDPQSKRNLVYLTNDSESIWSVKPAAVHGIDFWVGGQLPVDWVDYNNDRLVDLVRYELNGGRLSLHVYENSSRDGLISFEPSKTLNVLAKVVVPPDQLDWLDFNGDGLEDLFYLAKDNEGPIVRYHPNLGQLFTVTKDYGSTDQLSVDVPVLDAQSRPIRLTLDSKTNTRFSDLNSDGLPDLIYYSRGSLRYFISDGAALREWNQWSDAALAANTLFFEIGDTNANGSADLQFLTKNRELISFDLYDREHVPYLLESLANDSGWQNRYTYRSSLRGKTAAYYGADWSPATTQVVAQIQRFARTTTPESGVRQQLVSTVSFDYFGPRFDRFRREFLGFSEVQQKIDHDASGRRYTLSEQSFYTDEQDSLLQGILRSQKTSFIDLDHADQSRIGYEELQQTAAATKLLAQAPVYYSRVIKISETHREHGQFKTLVTTHSKEFDANGRAVRSIESEFDAENRFYRSQRTEFEHGERPGHWDQGLVRLIEKLGQNGQILHAKALEYDDNRSIKQISAFRNGAFELVAAFEYDAAGNRLKMSDGLGRSQSIEYESEGRFLPSASVNHSGPITLKKSVQWNYIHESPSAVTEENSHTSILRYDGRGRIIELIRPGSSSPVLTMRYQDASADQLGSIETSIRGRSGRAIEYFDSIGRSVASIVPSELGSIVETYQTFDLLGRPMIVGSSFALASHQSIETIKPDLSLASAYKWDYQSRVQTLTVPRPDLETNSFQSSRFEYELNLVRSINAEGESKSHHTDDFGRVYKTINHASGSDSTDRMALVKYDELDRVSELQLPNLSKRRYTWNTRDQLVELEAETGLYRFAYDASGQLVSRAIFDAQTKYLGSYAFTYDELGRMSAQYFSDAAEHAAIDLKKAKLEYRYHYDDWAEIPTLNHNQKGRLAALCLEDNSCYQYSYHPLGMLARETLRLGSTSAREMLQMLYTYDEEGRLESLTYPDGETLPHVYSPVTGQLISMPGLVEKAQFDELNRTTRLTMNANFAVDFAYYKNLDAVRESGTRLRDKRTFQSLSYDQLGRIIGISGSDPWFERVEKTFTYDSLGQLSKVHYDLNGKNSKGIFKSFSYAYDSHGFMSENDGQSVQIERQTVVTADQLIATVRTGDAVYSFDDAGRLESIQQTGKAPLLLQWTADNRLTQRSFPDGSTVKYLDKPDRKGFSEEKFDASGKKVRHEFSINPYVSYDQVEKKLTKYYRYGQKVVANRHGSDGDIKYLLADALGNIKGEVNGGGELLSYREFSPYGEAIAIQGTENVKQHGFAGYLGEAESESYQLQHRHYLPGIGLFMSPDPLFLSSPSSCLGDTASCNLYSYAQNDPVNYVDFNGLKPKRKTKRQQQQALGDDVSNKSARARARALTDKEGATTTNREGAMAEDAANVIGSSDVNVKPSEVARKRKVERMQAESTRRWGTASNRERPRMWASLSAPDGQTWEGRSGERQENGDEVDQLYNNVVPRRFRSCGHGNCAESSNLRQAFFEGVTNFWGYVSISIAPRRGIKSFFAAPCSSCSRVLSHLGILTRIIEMPAFRSPTKPRIVLESERLEEENTRR